MSRLRSLVPALLVALAVIVASPASAQSKTKAQARGKTTVGKIYCWDTPQGRQCSDTLPAEAAGAQREEISSRTGNVLKQVERAKTPEEIVLEKAQQEAAARAAADLAKLERERGNVKMRYDSVAAIRQEYADRRKGLEVVLKLAQDSERATHRALAGILSELSGLEMEGKKVTDSSFTRVQKTVQAWNEQRAGLAAAQARLAELDAEQAFQIQLWSADPAVPASDASALPIPPAPGVSPAPTHIPVP
jgi:hypothetical protein